MEIGEIESAERRALNMLDRWLEVAGLVEKHTGYYYELQSVIKDAVHCGIQQAVGDFKKLDGEQDGE